MRGEKHIAKIVRELGLKAHEVKGPRSTSQRRSAYTVYRAIPEAVNFAEGVEKIEDVGAGHPASLGIVTDVTGFGAFVDIGGTS